MLHKSRNVPRMSPAWFAQFVIISLHCSLHYTYVTHVKCPCITRDALVRAFPCDASFSSVRMGFGSTRYKNTQILLSANLNYTFFFFGYICVKWSIFKFKKVYYFTLRAIYFQKYFLYSFSEWDGKGGSYRCSIASVSLWY